ncbi:MAG: DUF2330 domain-containing protein [Phycisphaeraceae bacterium]|nr:DUF2330 domain-containing protein [Phycisphaeraceae bacterium]
MGCTQRVVVFLLLGLLMPATSCLADGKVFATEAIQTSIPRQQALLCYRNGVETLAIQTEFVGKGSEFAWVVPLPTPPEVTPTTTGLFPTIDALLVRELRTSPPYASVVAALVACVVLMNVHAVNVRIAAGLVIIVILLAISVFTPSLGRAGGPVAAGATLLDRKPIGSYDVATLTGSDSKQVVQWLAGHGFKVPPEVIPGLDHYIQKGWCFVAARLRTDAVSDQPMTPHPLVFRFKASEAIYPMYLTTLANSQPLRLDLYVLGDRQAEAKDLRTVQTRFALYDSSEPSEHKARLPVDTEFPVAHPSLLQIADHAPYLTHLSTTIQAGELSDDVELSWRRFELYQPTLYTYRARRLLAMDAALTLLIIGSLVVYLLTLDGKIARAKAPRFYGVVLFVALVLAVTMWMALPAAAAGHARWYHRSLRPRTLYIVQETIQPAIAEVMKSDPSLQIDYEWLHRFLFTEEGATLPPQSVLERPLREEDSPAGFNLRTTDEGFELVGFDRVGRPDVVAFRVPATPTTQPAE